MNDDIINPFRSEKRNEIERKTTATEMSDRDRSVTEIQAALTIAKTFPRNPIDSFDRIIQACTRPSLAERALYTYARGGTDITGPSIRLAEAIAQAWGNIEWGIREVEQRDGVSVVEAYAWDMESNTRQRKTFQVAHVRHTKNKGNVKLSDPRDIYEMTANQGARRVRACILGLIPSDVVESATDQCEKTLATNCEVTPARIADMKNKFAKLGVTTEMIERRIQRRCDAITPALMIQLGKIHNAISDGLGKPSDFFPVPSPAEKLRAADAPRPTETTVDEPPDDVELPE